MNDVFEMEGLYYDDKKLLLKDIPLYINIPEWIEERNIYTVDTKEQFATIKPKKFGGLTYRLLDIDAEFGKIKTVDYGECLIKITEALTTTNYPVYERGNY